MAINGEKIFFNASRYLDKNETGNFCSFPEPSFKAALF